MYTKKTKKGTECWSLIYYKTSFTSRCIGYQTIEGECRQVFIESALRFAAKEVEVPCSAACANSQYNEFFSLTTDASATNEEADVNRSQLQCLQDFHNTDRSMSAIKPYQVIEEMFVKYNTLIPSSASVERLFSTGGLVFTKRWNGFSDTTFEKLLLLKKN